MTKHALLIGVSKYSDDRLARLHAPAADVDALAEVLRDPDITGFDNVVPLVEPSREAVFDAVDDLFAEKARDDLVLLYFSGHGIRDDQGQLFFAVGGTRYNRPRGTGIPASELKHFMDECRSRRQVLILDCCHAGAFMEGHRAATAAPALTKDTFVVSGHGREILAATNATAYAFEGEEPRGDGTSRQLGKFTRFLVEGLRTGAGSTERGGITVGDLFEYARLKLEAEDKRMRPQYWRVQGEAPLIIAPNPQTRPRLPAELLAALDDEVNWASRLAAVERLDALVRGDDLRLSTAALAELERREPEEFDRRVHDRMRLVLRVEGGHSGEKPASAGPALMRRRTELDWPVGHVFRDVEAPWCPEMVVVPAGSFVMGSPESETGHSGHEGPQHRVTFAQPFAVGRYPTIRIEFRAFIDDTGYAVDGGLHRWDGSKWKLDEAAHWQRPGFTQTDRDPVVGVSWHDVAVYLGWLRRKTGKLYRLLSEAEWEYVARSGKRTSFWMGETISTAQANYNGNYIYGKGEKGEYRQGTMPVDVPELAANPFGVCHVHGNIWEWVEDTYHPFYNGAPGDGSPWLETGGQTTNRVLRGGSWFDNPGYLRAAARQGCPPGDRSDVTGFRVARVLFS